MNTPNKLTTIRIVMAPIFMAILLIDKIPHNYLIALVFFIVASITDLIDGRLARKNHQVTTYGKFLDPVADKILVLSALMGFVQLDITSAWVPLIVVTREFIVTSVRLLASTQGNVIAANIWGKIKTVVQMVAIITTLAFEGIREVLYMIAGLVKAEWFHSVINIASVPMIVTAFSKHLSNSSLELQD